MAKKKPAPKAAKKPQPKAVKKPAPKAAKKPQPKAKPISKAPEPVQAEMAEMAGMAEIISESQKEDELALEKIAALPVIEKFGLELTMTQTYDMEVEIVKEGWTRETLMAAVANGTVEIVGLDVFMPSGEDDLEKAVARIARADEIDDTTWEW